MDPASMPGMLGAAERGNETAPEGAVEPAVRPPKEVERSVRVVAYVDGFNLYHGLKAKHGRRYLWLDLEALVTSLLSQTSGRRPSGTSPPAFATTRPPWPVNRRI
jgi:hypothetical protein